jgi:hypothetical protein
MEEKLVVHSPKDLFKMNKFRNVPPKTDTHISHGRATTNSLGPDKENPSS